MRHAKGFARCIYKIAFQRLARREGHGVKKQMKLAKLAADFSKDAGDVIVLGDIARKNQRIGPERAGQFGDIFLEPFALVGKSERGPGIVPGLGDGPGDGPFVGDAYD